MSQKYLWKALRFSKYGDGVEVVGFFEAPRNSVLAGQTITQFIEGYATEEEARRAHPDANEGFTSKWTAPRVSVAHLPDEGEGLDDSEESYDHFNRYVAGDR